MPKNPGCSPGWYRIGDFCHLLNLKSSMSWRKARTFCHKQAADLAIIRDYGVIEHLIRVTSNLDRQSAMLYLGLKDKVTRWTWMNGSLASPNLWAPHEPRGDGKCGSLNKPHADSSDSVGRGWRLNDQRCDTQNGYICEQQNGRWTM